MDDATLRGLLGRELEEGFSGWDFSHLTKPGRMQEFPLDWNYRSEVEARLQSATSLLDLGTGGGEFLSSLEGRPERTCATEGYEPNLPLARSRLEPLGIKVSPIVDDLIPFPDSSFDLVIDRHESYLPAEIRRVLLPGGLFVTQQVGGMNEVDLNQALGALPPDYADWCLATAAEGLVAAGFRMEKRAECLGKTRFYDIGALAYYLHCVPWQVEDFSLDRYLPRLAFLASRIEEVGHVDFVNHRFLLVARAP